MKTKEQTISLNQNLESMQLLSQKIVDHHKKYFNYIHIGLVQIAIKPLFHLGLDILVYDCPRDAKATQFSDYVLSMIDAISNNVIKRLECFGGCIVIIKFL